MTDFDSNMVPIPRTMVANAKEFPPTAEMQHWNVRGRKKKKERKSTHASHPFQLYVHVPHLLARLLRRADG
jgi:hypothetical protein